MHLPALRAHATEASTGPRFPHSAHKEFFLAVCVKQSVICSRKLEGLLSQGRTNSKHQHPTSREAPISKPQTNRTLEIGIWHFSGSWRLEFGGFHHFEFSAFFLAILF